jgi:hypothetical protein
MPELAFDVWLTGLVAFVIGLALMAPLVERGPRVLRGMAVAFAGLMVLNGAAHIAGTVAGRTVPTVRFDRPMPGFWSAPLLIAAAVHFIVVRRRHADG